MTEIDPLDMNVSDIDTSRPRLAPATYTMEVAKAEKVQAKKSGNDQLAITVKTVKEEQATDGTTIHPGFSLTTYIGVVPTGERTNKQIAQDIASLSKSAQVNGKARDIIDNPQILIGRQVQARIGIKPEDGQYPESNKVSGFVTARA